MTGPVVITGASRGIGRACALAFADRGLDVALLARSADGLERVQQEAGERGVTARSYRCDVSQAGEVTAAAERMLEDLGTPAGVINNAGQLGRRGDVAEVDVADWDRILAVNLRGAMLISQALLPAMLEHGSGRVLFVASISGTMGYPGHAAYCASKWGLIGLCKTLAEELRGTGLQAAAVLPGAVDTAMLAETPFSPLLTAEDVARVIAFHTLDAPAAINGSTIEIFG